MNKNLGILLFVVGVVLMGSLVLAADIDNSVQGATVTKGSTVRASAASIGTDTAAAGNVTNMNLTTSGITAKWQGYYGNASLSQLRLGTGASTNLYSWTTSLKSNVLGVFASTGSDFDFSAISAASASSYDSILNWATSDADTVANTMTGGSKTVIMGAFSSVPVANLTHYETGVTSTNSKFSVGIFAETGASAQGDYAVGVNNSVGPWMSYDNATAVSYEMIVPVGGNNPTTGQTYNFWLALK